MQNNPTQVYVGTNDFGATDEAPDGFGVPGNNMLNTQTNFYDNGDPVGGDGLVTSIIQHIDGTTANDRQTGYGYDFRDRLTTTTAFIVPTGTVLLGGAVNMLDNLDRTSRWTSSRHDAVADADRFESRRPVRRPGPGLSGRWFARCRSLADPPARRARRRPAIPGSTPVDTCRGLSRAAYRSYSKTQYDEVSRASGTFTGYAGRRRRPVETLRAGDHS